MKKEMRPALSSKDDGSELLMILIRKKESKHMSKDRLPAVHEIAGSRCDKGRTSGFRPPGDGCFG